MGDLGDRYIEAAAQAVLEALDDVTLVFERMGVLHVYLKREDSNRGHLLRSYCTASGISAATRSIVNASMTSPTWMSLKPASEIPHS